MRRVKIGGTAAGRQLWLVMRPHCILDAGVRIMNVSHGNVAVAVAWLNRHHGRSTSTGRVICVVQDGRSRAYSGSGGGSIGMILVVAVGGSSSLRMQRLLGLLQLLLWYSSRCGDGWRLASVISRHLRVASVVIVTARGGSGRRVVVLLPVMIHCSEAAKAPR